jgi:hypothetical protein
MQAVDGPVLRMKIQLKKVVIGLRNSPAIYSKRLAFLIGIKMRG